MKSHFTVVLFSCILPASEISESQNSEDYRVICKLYIGVCNTIDMQVICKTCYTIHMQVLCKIFVTPFLYVGYLFHHLL